MSTKLVKDLVNRPNNGLVIGADDITLDLSGHVIDGDDAEFADCPPTRLATSASSTSTTTG